MQVFSRKINLNYGGFALGLLLNLSALQSLYADSNSQNSIHDQRLAQEANALINPSPMQTVSALPAISSTPALANSTSSANAQKTAPATSPTTPAIQNKLPKETGVMAYYDALINNCQKGVFDFDNPAYMGTGKKVSMTASVGGFQSGYCVVNIFFSNQTSSINCLFSNKDLLVLKDPKARTAFSNAYAQGELDSAKKTPYDKIIANVCQMN